MSQRSAAFLATRLLPVIEASAARHHIVAVGWEPLAEALGPLLDALLPDRVCRFLPAWDCVPYDRASPSAEIMGQRMRAVRVLGAADKGVLVTTPEALIQRLPLDRAVSRPIAIKAGHALAVGVLEAELLRLGYVRAVDVEDVGQFALRGEVLDVFPAGPTPVRIDLEDGRATSIHRFDPSSQRRRGAALDAVTLGPVSEVLAGQGSAPVARFAGMEHWLPALSPKRLGTLFDLLPQAAILAEPGTDERLVLLRKQVEDAHGARRAVERSADDSVRHVLDPDRMYLNQRQWGAAFDGRALPFPDLVGESAVPRFFREPHPARAFRAFVTAQRDAGRRVVLAAGGARALATLVTQADHATGQDTRVLTSWHDVRDAGPDRTMALPLPVETGFVDEAGMVALVAAADLLGPSTGGRRHHMPVPWHGADGAFALEDAVIHMDHGMGVLKGLERFTTADGAATEIARLDFAKGADLLAPVDDLHRVWRYGAGDSVTLDRLDGTAWEKKRGKIRAEIDAAATHLVSVARRRQTVQALRLVPEAGPFGRFCEGFAFALTPDQDHAVRDVLADLRSGRAMDRLVVGDVGFGKTEVALRAAAAVVLAGRQVAVIAPTTVLARQHVDTFRKRFESLGIEVGHISRLVSPAEGQAVRAGLAAGRVRVVVGTHALVGESVDIPELGLLIVDEEQRFGAEDKHRLRALGEAVHTLTLSATPIPRTLQAALVGLQELSVIQTAPARRRPIRTLVEPFDLSSACTALRLEHARGGQSFVVVPRIEDLERFAGVLAKAAPDLAIVMAHGGLDPHETDDVMVDFAAGRGDVLVATAIIESGLDVPRANTMLVIDADRFGLGQLHQLRGRVGRGRQQGVCYLLTDPERPVGEAGRQRLATLVAHNRLGSGFTVSAHDLDSRGGGDMTGDTQSGHLKLIGLGLYQHLLQRALRDARGEPAEDWTPDINTGESGAIPESYIPETVQRLNLYARLARASEAAELDALEEEVEDRFGPPPAALVALIGRARLRCLCRSHAVERVDIGPKAVAFALRDGARFVDLLPHIPAKHRDQVQVKGQRLVVSHDLADPAARLSLAASLLGDRI